MEQTTCFQQFTVKTHKLMVKLHALYDAVYKMEDGQVCKKLLLEDLISTLNFGMDIVVPVSLIHLMDHANLIHHTGRTTVALGFYQYR
jgi:hypothetical protein